jgi:hypothetical protein
LTVVSRSSVSADEQLIESLDAVDLALLDAPQGGVEHLEGTWHPQGDQAALMLSMVVAAAWTIMTDLPPKRGARRLPDRRQASAARHAPRSDQ